MVAVAVAVRVAVAVEVAVAVAVRVGVEVADELEVLVEVAVAVAVGRMLPDSNAPTSQAGKTLAPISSRSGRVVPRWSVFGHSSSGTLSMAGLFSCSPMVLVGPPLS